MMMDTRYYLLHVREDVDPEVLGPYSSIEERNAAALKLKAGEDAGGCDSCADDQCGIYQLEIRGESLPPILTVEANPYSGGFFSEERANPDVAMAAWLRANAPVFDMPSEQED